MKPAAILYSGQIKNKFVLVRGLKSLGCIGTHIFWIFFLEKNMTLCILKGISPYKMQ